MTDTSNAKSYLPWLVATALFMEQLDATIVNTAIPSIAASLQVTPLSLKSVVTCYILSLAVGIPVSGWMADRFGTRRVIGIAIAIFTIASVLCGLAVNAQMMVVARLLQGLGGAMMMPVGRLVLLRSVARKDMVNAMSWLLVPALIGPILGPPVGGLIVTYLDWRWIFYINVPIGIIGMIFVSIFIDEVKGKAAGPFDTLGFILSGISLGSMLFGFELSSHEGQGSFSIFLIAIGLLIGIAYLRHARKHPAPIMDFSLMKVPSFGTSVIAGSLTRITQGAQPFLLPLLFQIGFGLSAAAAGQIVISTALGALFMKPLAKAVFRRVGFRRSLIINGILGTIGYGLCAAFRPDWPMPLIFIALVLSAFFMSFQFTAYNTIAYDEISQDRMSSATSFYTTFQQLMLSLGICIGALALHASMAFNGVETPELGDFSTAFIVVAIISISATIWNLRFSPTAGEEISGYKAKQTKGAAAGS
jgi:EmrB/QacA subfamily drug resistance transporter